MNRMMRHIEEKRLVFCLFYKFNSFTCQTICHSLGLSENTLIVFYSDNGGAAAATNNFRLRGAKGMPYEGGIRVPLIMKYPRYKFNSFTCQTICQVLSLTPLIQSQMALLLSTIRVKIRVR